MVDSPIPLKAAKKREAILRYALKVFAKEGFRNADVQVIADLAGVGKGTVYRHFGNKEQLFLATAKFNLERIGNHVDQRLGGDENVAALIRQQGTAELLRRIAQASAEYCEKHPQGVEIMIQERAEFRGSVYPSHLMFRAERRAGIQRLFEQALERGEFRPCDPVAAIDAFGDLIFGSIVNGCLEGNKSRLVPRVESAVELLLHGLVQPRAQQPRPGQRESKSQGS